MKARYLLVLPLGAALILQMVMAHTPGTHTGLFVATTLCVLVVVVGVAALWTQSFSQPGSGDLASPQLPADRESDQAP